MNAEKKQFRARAFLFNKLQTFVCLPFKERNKTFVFFLGLQFFAMNNVLDKKKKAEDLNEYDDLKEHVKSISTKKRFYAYVKDWLKLILF